MKLIDYHIHCNYSVDNHNKIADIIKRISEMDFYDACIITHFEFDKYQFERPNSIRMNEFNKYFREIEKFNKEFGQHIKAGIEVGYAPPKEERIRKILSDYPFDFVLGSCHALDGKLIFEEPIFREMTRENVTKTYFHTISQMITSGLFDSIAHMDVIRHGRFVYGDFPFSCYKNEMEEIAKELKQRNMCFEINTNPYRAESGKPALYPCEEALKVLYEKGAHKITLGSDAHTIERIGEGLPAAVDILKEIGFKNVYLFNKRKESHIELSMLR